MNKRGNLSFLTWCKTISGKSNMQQKHTHIHRECKRKCSYRTRNTNSKTILYVWYSLVIWVTYFAVVWCVSDSVNVLESFSFGCVCVCARKNVSCWLVVQRWDATIYHKICTHTHTHSYYIQCTCTKHSPDYSKHARCMIRNAINKRGFEYCCLLLLLLSAFAAVVATSQNECEQ